jgi:hypothetical protein
MGYDHIYTIKAMITLLDGTEIVEPPETVVTFWRMSRLALASFRKKRPCPRNGPP